MHYASFEAARMTVTRIVHDKHCHSIYIRTVSSFCLVSVLVNWFLLVVGLFIQSNMHHKLDICSEGNQMYQR